MSSDGEITKNQQSEGDAKANLDTTDSSQDSVGVKSEGEDEKDSKVDEVKEKEKDKPEEPVKTEEVTTNDSANQNDTDKKEKNDVEAKNSKEEKNEEKTDEDNSEAGDNSGEEEEEEDEDEEDDDKKDVPLLDQPLEKSGPRERKKVQRFTEDAESKEITKVDIPSGGGTSLGNIPRIDASISRFKTDDLKLLHKVLFKTPGKTVIIKKNIKKFNGFDFDKDSEEYTKKVSSVSKMEIKQLKSICEMLDLEKNGKKEEISERICEFLMEPKDSGKPSGGGRPKRTAAVRANNRGYSSHDDEDDSDSGSKGKRASRSRRGKGKRVNLKEESSSESDAEFNPSEESDEETPRVKSKRSKRSVQPKKAESEEEVSDVEETPSSDDSDEPKSKRKRAPVVKVQNNKSKKTPAKNAKATPKKSPAANKKKAETKKPAGRKRGKEESDEEEEDDEKDNSENNEESSSGDDEPLVKKSKSPQPPTDEEIKTYVKQILEGANLEEITMKTVCKQVYAHYPDFDLAHKKDFIKTTVKSLIST